MHKFIKKISQIIIIVSLLCNPLISLGQSAEEENQVVRDLNSQIQAAKDRVKKVQEQQEVYAEAILKKQAKKATLANQLSILENRLAQAALDIERTRTEIDRTNLEIKKVNLEIEQKDEEITRQKDHLGSVIRLMQRQDDKSTLEIFLLNGTLNEFLNQIKYLEDINKEISRSLDELKKFKAELEARQKELKGKNQELTSLKNELENKKFVLATDQQNKTYILDQTRSSEKEYQRLLNLARAEQQQAQADIVNLEKAVRAKIQKISGQELQFNDAGFIWPVAKNMIIATFHDPEYPFRYIFEHPAVDIRAAQGSSVRAAASGYVAIAKDAGKGYSYIMIVHGDGLATVYGHVSRIFVAPDEYVVQGQAIALSGGTPGTNGAGRLTTGPHLHFEVRLNGLPVDPQEYLP